MQTILIIEDDPKISSLLQTYLEKYRYHVVTVKDFDHILELFHQVQPEMVLLDVNLPSYDGFYWCRQIKKTSTCPILFISAREEKMDQVMALQNGADDYITKPFFPEVLLAKIESHIRRAYGLYAGNKPLKSVKVSSLVLYPELLELTLGEKKVQLSNKETALLELLLEHPQQVITREHLLDVLWDDHQFVNVNTLNVYVTRVRKKLSELGIVDALETVRGSVKEMKRAATIQIAILFLIPILIASIEAVAGSLILNKQFGFYNMLTPSMMGVTAFFVIQFLYFLLARTRYLSQLDKVMV